MSVETIKNASGQAIGCIEYEKGYGVHARRFHVYGGFSSAVFSTSGYRAAIGFQGDYNDARKAKAAARRWVRG